MAATFDTIDHTQPSPDERLEEVSALLAIAMRRLLLLHTAPSHPGCEIPDAAPSQFPENCLDDASRMRLSVPRG
jgi:hypothetical protein